MDEEGGQLHAVPDEVGGGEGRIDICGLLWRDIVSDLFNLPIALSSLVESRTLTAIIPITIVGIENTTELAMRINFIVLKTFALRNSRWSREYKTQLCGTTMISHVR